MRVFRGESGALVILKLTLPTAGEGSAAERAVSEFYSLVAEAYIKGAECLLSAAKDAAAPILVHVDYSLDSSGSPDGSIAIKRVLKVRARGVLQNYEDTDLFDVENGRLFLPRRRQKVKKVKKKASG